MKALVVNCSVDRTPAGRSREYYNLGAAKLARWLGENGYDVATASGDPGMFVVGYDLVCVSVIFSWHAMIARDVALRAMEYGAEVWAGGPGLQGVRGKFEAWTGIKPVWKPDPRFDRHRGRYRMIYAVRGCEGESVDDGLPIPCAWCNVPKVEGTVYVLDPDFPPAPMLLDNNVSGMPLRMQLHIIKRYQESGVVLRDCNSGFEPGRFDRATRERWEPVLKGPWRWGFDRIDEEAHAQEMARLLADVSPRRKLVYAMCGNEPEATCYERAMKVIEWGCEPHVQFMVPHGALDRFDATTWPERDQPKHGWTIARGRDFARYFNSRIWRTVPIAEYRPRVNEPPPFLRLAA